MLIRLKEDPQDYNIGKRIEFGHPAFVRKKDKNFLPIWAKIDTGAFISILFCPKKDLIENKPIEVLDDKKREPIAYDINKCPLIGDYCMIKVKFYDRGRIEYSIPVLLVEHKEKFKLLLGSLGFIAKYNLVIIPQKSNASIVY